MDKPILHRRCPVCGWYQVRAEDKTTFMYTPCEFHGVWIRSLLLGGRNPKDKVEIVDVVGSRVVNVE